MDEICKNILKKGVRIEMVKKISWFLREYVFGLSIVLTLIGAVVFIFGVLGIWIPDFLEDLFKFPRDSVAWSPYIFLIGVIVLLTGTWYLYDYLRNKRFVLEELKTNKRSEFIKKRSEIHEAVRLLPSKYKQLLKEKEKELKIK